ncbi:MAG: arylsulfatase [Candidatus Aminicenantes bacterium]|nr:arylsulfatase [Candidatus Aminicenantes bacterium]
MKTLNMNFKRRDFLKAISIGVASVAVCDVFRGCRSSSSRPNIIYILADDLGYGELGCYGQQKIRTPNIDKLAAQGIKFTQHYSGSPVCAPSRCTLLTGKHTGHCYVRDNDEMGGWEDPTKEGQRPLPPDTKTLSSILKKAGYTTGAIGKWGLGGPGTTGEPNKQGFDYFYGYNCQRQAHSYYPTHLWRNDKKHMLEGNENGRQGEYSHDLMANDALKFIKDNKDRRFFLYIPFTIPHVSIQVPEDSLNEYKDKWPETPFIGKHYASHSTPRAGYAAMITRMDRDIGRIMALLKELGLDNNTLVIFSSDNGPTFAGGVDAEFFKSAGPLRGLKCSVYEGGIRVPMVARWPGHIAPGTTSDHVSAFWDVLPTLAEIAGTPVPKDIDGISFRPALLGKTGQKKHDFLYWEYHSYGGRQAVRMGDWKGIRLNVKENPNGPIELYNLRKDIGEEENVAGKHPDIVKKIDKVMKSRIPSEIPKWNFGV